VKSEERKGNREREGEMTEQYDFKKEWPKIKKKLMEVSQEAVVLAKKGEVELIKFSQKSKLHVDAAALNLKKEKLFYQIGKEYVRLKCPGEKTGKLKSLVDELDAVSLEEKALKRKIKASAKQNAKKE
jgi:hypothetical protein